MTETITLTGWREMAERFRTVGEAGLTADFYRTFLRRSGQALAPREAAQLLVDAMYEATGGFVQLFVFADRSIENSIRAIAPSEEAAGRILEAYRRMTPA